MCFDWVLINMYKYLKYVWRNVDSKSQEISGNRHPYTINYSNIVNEYKRIINTFIK